MLSLVDTANAERDAAKTALAKAKKQLDKANDKAHRMESELIFHQNQLNAERRHVDEARHDLDVAQSDLAETKKELERVKAEAEQRAKASPVADTDLQKFAVLFEQVQASLNQMHGIALKQPDDKREKLKNALLSLAEQIRKAAES